VRYDAFARTMQRDPAFDYQRYLASRNWALKKVAVGERADGMCERCSRGPMESVHHLTYQRIGLENLEDLLGVCNPCHAWLSAKADYDPVVAILGQVRDALSAHEGFWGPHADCPGICRYSTIEEYAAYYGICHGSALSTGEYDRLKRAARYYEEMLAL
jgi:hypothetical protein